MKKHTEYLNSERPPTVCPEPEELLPELSAEEFSALEADILANGCKIPLRTGARSGAKNIGAVKIVPKAYYQGVKQSKTQVDYLVFVITIA